MDRVKKNHLKLAGKPDRGRRPRWLRWLTLCLLAQLACIAGMATAVSATEDPENPFPFEMHLDRLENGLTVVTIPMNTPDLVAYGTLVRVGSRDEIWPGRTGFAHFVEHLMFRGTEKYPTKDYEAILASLGADHNAFTSNDITFYHCVLSKAGLARVVDLEADRFRNIKYSEEDYKTEAGAVLGEYLAAASNPSLLLEETLRKAAYSKHTYRHTTLGHRADIEGMPHQYAFSKEFYGRFYTPDNIHIFVAGDVDRQEVLDLVKSAYGEWDKKLDPVQVESDPAPKSRVRERVSWKGPTPPRLILAWHVPAFDTADSTFATLEVIAELLFGQISPLYTRLVLEEQIVESLTYRLGTTRDPGLLRFEAVVRDAKNVDKVIAAVEEEVAGLVKNGVPEERLDPVRSYLRYGLLASLETPHDVITHLARITGAKGSPQDASRHLSHYGRVDREQVAKVAGEYLRDHNLTEVVLLPESSKGGKP